MAAHKDHPSGLTASELQTPFAFAQQEEEILKYWREIDAFKTSLEQSKDRKPYSFYDGPVSRAVHLNNLGTRAMFADFAYSADLAIRYREC